MRMPTTESWVPLDFSTMARGTDWRSVPSHAGHTGVVGRSHAWPQLPQVMAIVSSCGSPVRSSVSPQTGHSICSAIGLSPTTAVAIHRHSTGAPGCWNSDPHPSSERSPIFYVSRTPATRLAINSAASSLVNPSILTKLLHVLKLIATDTVALRRAARSDPSSKAELMISVIRCEKEADSLFAKIIFVADAFDAVTTPRSFQSAWRLRMQERSCPVLLGDSSIPQLLIALRHSTVTCWKGQSLARTASGSAPDLRRSGVGCR